MSNKNKYNDILKLNICEKDSNTFHRNKNQLTLGNVDEGFIEEVKILTELFFISEFYEPDPKNRGRLMIKEKYHNLLNLNSNCEEYDDY